MKPSNTNRNAKPPSTEKKNIGHRRNSKTPSTGEIKKHRATGEIHWKYTQDANILQEQTTAQLCFVQVLIDRAILGKLPSQTRGAGRLSDPNNNLENVSSQTLGSLCLCEWESRSLRTVDLPIRWYVDFLSVNLYPGVVASSVVDAGE